MPFANEWSMNLIPLLPRHFFALPCSTNARSGTNSALANDLGPPWSVKHQDKTYRIGKRSSPNEETDSICKSICSLSRRTQKCCDCSASCASPIISTSPTPAAPPSRKRPPRRSFCIKSTALTTKPQQSPQPEFLSPSANRHTNCLY